MRAVSEELCGAEAKDWFFLFPVSSRCFGVVSTELVFRVFSCVSGMPAAEAAVAASMRLEVSADVAGEAV